MGLQMRHDIVTPALLAYVLLVPFLVFFASKFLNTDAMFFLGTTVILLGGVLYRSLIRTEKALQRRAQMTVCAPMRAEAMAMRRPLPARARAQFSLAEIPVPQDCCLAPAFCQQAEIRPCAAGLAPVQPCVPVPAPAEIPAGPKAATPVGARVAAVHPEISGPEGHKGPCETANGKK